MVSRVFTVVQTYQVQRLDRIPTVTDMMNCYPNIQQKRRIGDEDRIEASPIDVAEANPPVT